MRVCVCVCVRVYSLPNRSLSVRCDVACSHFQQDAHEFLLNVVNEYEKELVLAVKSAIDKVTQDDEATEAAAAPKRSSLLNFFRSESKRDAESKSQKQETAAADDGEDLVGELLPAKCFRAELYRTLTCSACGYSRKQVEMFYDFSLDLPLSAAQRDDFVVAAAREKPAKRQCFCEADAAIRNTITERIYYCAKAACSYQEKVANEMAVETPCSEQQPEAEAVDVDMDAPTLADASHPPHGSAKQARSSIALDSLMKKQFESETLELSCEKCKTGNEAVAAYAVKSLPPVIVLHLKRFEVDFKTGKLHKRCDLVEAPAIIYPKQVIVGDSVSEEGGQSFELMVRLHSLSLDTCVADVDLCSFVASPLLQSVVHHLGRSIDEGHYVTDVREHGATWVRRNDTHESVVRTYVLSVRLGEGAVAHRFLAACGPIV